MVALRSTQLAKPNASRDIAKALEKQLRITLDNRT